MERSITMENYSIQSWITTIPFSEIKTRTSILLLKRHIKKSNSLVLCCRTKVGSVVNEKHEKWNSCILFLKCVSKTLMSGRLRAWVESQSFPQHLISAKTKQHWNTNCPETLSFNIFHGKNGSLNVFVSFTLSPFRFRSWAASRFV